MAPALGRQLTFDGANNSSAVLLARMDTLEAQADAGLEQSQSTACFKMIEPVAQRTNGLRRIVTAAPRGARSINAPALNGAADLSHIGPMLTASERMYHCKAPQVQRA